MREQLNNSDENHVWMPRFIMALAVFVVLVMILISYKTAFAKESDGAQITFDRFQMNEMVAPVAYRNGKVYFKANGENIDITDEFSYVEPFIYSYKDNNAITHYWLVGGNAERYGCAEFMRADSGSWLGAYFKSELSGRTSDPIWLQNGKKELGIP